MTAAVLTPVLTVGLVGDHPVGLLSGVDGLRIVVCTADGAGIATPDVLIVDGVRSLRAVRDRVPGVPVLVVTTADDVESVFNAMRAGARGYLLRGAERADIVRAVRGVAAGEMILGAQIASRLTDLMIRQAQPSHPFPTLSAREREIMELIAVGADNSTIARRLDLAPKTVRNNVCTIFGKLGITDRAEAIARARAAGLPRAS
ncbi:MAG TPA: response regulator transcription factor [Actinophytocola sp.]|uniref:response regulator transcription factor n=1 Tax=Actinophytocola sp. TaxID=1872138 RepID=UPI002DB91845|nr:response regulator transcription factor [Actinophytocola sp.]HEU5475097.1 response regulator transcription factor [Actinophytocola sp.]